MNNRIYTISIIINKIYLGENVSKIKNANRIFNTNNKTILKVKVCLIIIIKVLIQLQVKNVSKNNTNYIKVNINYKSSSR